VSDLPPQIATPFFAPAPAGPPEETKMPDEMNYSPREGPLRERGKTGSLVAFPRARLSKRPSDNLPLELTSSIGREREVSEVKVLLAGRRLLTLCGPGGAARRGWLWRWHRI
jgi:hypothetical protein